MSVIEEKEILRRLKILSNIEPTFETTECALERVRRTLKNDHKKHRICSLRIGPVILSSKIAKLAAAAVLLVSVLGILAWLTSGNGTASVAWADVQRLIRNARTCTFKMTVQLKGRPETKGNVMTMEPGLMRHEITEPHRVVIVSDFPNGRILSLREEQKKATIFEISNLPKKAAQRFQEQSWMHLMKELVERSETELGAKQMNGRLAKGYQVDTEDYVLTAWVDTETGELLYVEIIMPRGEAKIVMWDLEFDKELDKKLFSMKPPEGYTTVEKPRSLDFTEPSFEDVGVLLGVLAKMKGGQFPESLPDNPSMATYMKDLKGLDRTLGEQEAMKVAKPMARGIMFLAKIRPAGHYAGNGVKLGDADTAIFWYRPKGSEAYRVIYGDLSIKDVAERDLPKAPSKKPTE